MNWGGCRVDLRGCREDQGGCVQQCVVKRWLVFCHTSLTLCCCSFRLLGVPLMASKGAVSRLKKELVAVHKDPPPYIQVSVDEKDILVWDYLLEGPPNSLYHGGWYHGRLRFPKEYPFKPPEITMLTPSGRFEPRAPLCLSMSNFHPETWNPMWSVGTVLTGQPVSQLAHLCCLRMAHPCFTSPSTNPKTLGAPALLLPFVARCIHLFPSYPSITMTLHPVRHVISPSLRGHTLCCSQFQVCRWCVSFVWGLAWICMRILAVTPITALPTISMSSIPILAHPSPLPRVHALGLQPLSPPAPIDAPALCLSRPHTHSATHGCSWFGLT